MISAGWMSVAPNWMSYSWLLGGSFEADMPSNGGEAFCGHDFASSWSARPWIDIEIGASECWGYGGGSGWSALEGS